jgi:hypothetical protein
MCLVSVILSMLLIWHHMMERTIEHRSRHLLKGEDDEGIPTSLPSSIDDIAGRVDVHHKPNDLYIGQLQEHVPSYWNNR